ncbi:MAG: adenylate/guanylate cyclase domain-containing protein [Lachnospiraceae bacterium]|nr:adenylate/guanylate cyclase domain-containing protein [Lachnospiraceae bacterium]
MDRIIWIIEDNRENLLDAQRKINSHDGMKAMCILSVPFLQKVIAERIDVDEKSISNPSLVLIDYDIAEKNTEYLSILKTHPKLAGVPVFIMAGFLDSERLEECYLKGAMLVVEKPLNKRAILRMDNASWQYELSKNYERVVQKQISELETSKEIKMLNTQLENRNEFLYSVFGKYFSDELIDIILSKREGEFIGGEKTQIAVLFSDLRGFTSLSESMDAQSITDMLNCYFGIMSDIIIKYGGTIIEFLGDGILAVFGAPNKCEDYAAKAVAAAIDMQNSIWKVNDFCRKKGYEELQMGIGVHCGEGFVGNVGTERMMRYNVIGRVVNICSRIESNSVGGQVIVSEHIVKEVSDKISIVEVREIQGKGMKVPMKICVISGIGGKYNVYLNEKEDSFVYKLAKDIYVNVYGMSGKLLEKEGLKARLMSVAKDKLTIHIVDEASIGLYEDIVISHENDDLSGFSDVYGKVVEKTKDENIVINLTKVNNDYKKFWYDIEQGKVELELEWRVDMKNRADVKIIKCNESDMVAYEEYFDKLNEKFVLAYWCDEEDIHIHFYSKDKTIRALEIMDFIANRYSIVKGDGVYAYTNMRKTFWNVCVSDEEATDDEQALERIIDNYYIGKCDWIFASDYCKDNKDDIEKLPLYKKKRVSWAYVKTTDIVPMGESFKMKSLENETDMEFVASDDMYIMIGCRGEIYNISSEKFHMTYEKSEEKFDIFEQMPDYIPEVLGCKENEYISLDDKAYLCYPKSEKKIYVSKIEKRTKIFSEHNKGEYFVGMPGDYMAVREDDISDIYIIQREIFEQTYEKV